MQIPILVKLQSALGIMFECLLSVEGWNQESWSWRAFRALLILLFSQIRCQGQIFVYSRSKWSSHFTNDLWRNDSSSMWSLSSLFVAAFSRASSLSCLIYCQIMGQLPKTLTKAVCNLLPCWVQFIITAHCLWVKMGMQNSSITKTDFLFPLNLLILWHVSCSSLPAFWQDFQS